MQDVELLAEWVRDLAPTFRREIEGLSAEGLAWQPDPQANSIGVTVWHCARWLDVLAVRVLQGRPAEEEQWHTRGWREKTGYDPRGIGAYGFGAITGYTWDEVRAIPALPASELVDYLDQTCTALHEQIRRLSSEALHLPAPGGGKRTAYGWIAGILKGCLGHVGEIQALKAMRERAGQESAAV